MAKRKTREEKEKMKGYNEELGITDGQFRGYIVNSLRETFRNTRKRAFVRKVRVPYRGPKNWKFYVECVHCEKQMGHTEKFRPRKANGTLSKRETSVFEVDHREGITPYKTLSDLTIFALDLFEGPLCILCYQCHSEKTQRVREAKKVKR